MQFCVLYRGLETKHLFCAFCFRDATTAHVRPQLPVVWHPIPMTQVICLPRTLGMPSPPPNESVLFTSSPRVLARARPRDASRLTSAKSRRWHARKSRHAATRTVITATNHVLLLLLLEVSLPMLQRRVLRPRKTADFLSPRRRTL